MLRSWIRRVLILLCDPIYNVMNILLLDHELVVYYAIFFLQWDELIW